LKTNEIVELKEFLPSDEGRWNSAKLKDGGVEGNQKEQNK